MTLSGLYVPLITPFAADGTVASAALARVAHEVLDDGATGLVALGTTGEPGSLSEVERTGVVTTLARVCRDRSAPLIVGAAPSTPAAASSTPAAARSVPAEAVAALTLVPPFVRPGVEGVLAHLRATAAASPVPLVVYHVPQRTGQDLPVDALRRIADIPGVIGMKYATGHITPDAVAFLTDLPRAFTVLCGDDALLTPMLSLGAAGAIAASAHLATADFAHLIASRSAVRSPTAAGPSGPDVPFVSDPADRLTTGGLPPGGRGSALARLANALFAEPNPTVIKAVLHAQGRIPTAAVRLPLLSAAPASRDAAVALLRGFRGGCTPCA